MLLVAPPAQCGRQLRRDNGENGGIATASPSTAMHHALIAAGQRTGLSRDGRVTAMSNPAATLMDVDAFLAWAEGRAGRWELRDGRPVMMAPERAAHALTKFAAQESLKGGVLRAGLPCRVFPDGMTVRVSAKTAFEPDALIVCPSPADLDTMEIPAPMVVVEVLSPSTAADDHGPKLDGYLSLPSVEHYLILDPDRRVMIWHKRGEAGAIETRILREGQFRLDPPGLTAEVERFFAGA